MASTDLMNARGLVQQRTTENDGRGGERVVYVDRPGPTPTDDYWPVQVSQPTATDRLAADNDVAQIDGVLYFPPDCPVARHDRVLVVDDPDPAPWRVEALVVPSRRPHVRASCTRDQDEGGAA